MAKLELDSETIATLNARGTDWDALGINGLQRHEAGNPRSVISCKRFKAYKKPRIIGGVVVCSRELKTEKSSGLVYFSDEEYTKPVRQGNTEETIVTLSSEYWDGKRVNMHGNRGERKDKNGSNCVRVSRKSAKQVEIIRKK